VQESTNPGWTPALFSSVTGELLIGRTQKSPAFSAGDNLFQGDFGWLFSIGSRRRLQNAENPENPNRRQKDPYLNNFIFAG
jgi:hypothetical protein